MTNIPPPKTLLVDDNESLKQLCNKLSLEHWLAIDTEFVRERTYYPQLCLIQVASPSGYIACIDVLAITDCHPIIDILTDASIQKVLHSCTQDMQVLTELCGRSLKNVFDTQLAAALLGIGDQISYAKLVELQIGIKLPKSQARTNWAARPLSEAQLRYAIDDVVYLAQLFPHLHEQLQQKGRSNWLDDEHQTLCERDRYHPPFNEAWKRLARIQYLKDASLSIAQALAAWREITAQQRDIPRNWLLKDHCITNIAQRQPQSIEDFKSIKGVTDKKWWRFYPAWLEVCQKAALTPPVPLTASLRLGNQPAVDEALMKRVNLLIDSCADQHGIPATVIASKIDKIKMINGSGDSRLLKGWRGELVGKALKKILDSELPIAAKREKTASPKESHKL